MRASETTGRRATPRRWSWWTFVGLELLALLAVPVLGYVGIQALLDTRAGTFVVGPGPDDPGYQALVEPSPVHVVLERRDGVLVGLTLLTQPGGGADGGAAVLVPAELHVEGQSLADWSQAGDLAAVGALARALRLQLGQPEVLDEAGWARLLGDRVVSVDNPDPVLVDGDLERFAAGRIELEAQDVADWVGLQGNQEASALLFRRMLLWEALLDQGLIAPQAPEPAPVLAQIAAGPHRVELLPVEAGGEPLITDSAEAEALIVDVVPFPAGSRPGDRLRVRVLDRTGTADLDEMARVVARAGGQVVVVGNASVFDGAPTEAVIADAALDEPARRLLDRIGTGTVSLSPGSDDTIDVTVLAGPDLIEAASG